MSPSGEVDTLVEQCRDEASPARDRVDAARRALWLVENEWGYRDEDLFLARMILSRWLDGLEVSDPAGHEFVTAWRSHDLVGPYSPFRAQGLGDRHALILAKLLFDRVENTAAIPFFERALRSAEASARTALLAAYNFERLGRERRDAHAIDQALAILAESRFKPLRGSDDAVAEVLHCSGHLYLLRAQVGGRVAGGYARRGSDLLRQAADLDPSYTSCFTSSFAEQGDYVGTIAASLEALQRRQFASLPVADAVTVALEVLFYLGYAFSCVGEYERARECFASFGHQAARMNEQEARDHARLFTVKLDLKKRLTSELTLPELQQFYQELRTLSFRSPLSAPVGEETRRYERVLEFLLALVTARGHGVPGNQTLTMIGRRPSADLSGATVRSMTLADAFQRGREVIEQLERERPALTPSAICCVLVVDTKDGSADPAVLEVEELLREFEHLWDVRSVRIERLVSELGRLSDQFDILGVWLTDARSVEVLRQAASLRRCVVVHPVSSRKPIPGHICTESNAAFLQVLVTGAALAMSKRFLLDDEYIFGLTPCVNSPATQFQHAEYDLREIRESRSSRSRS